MKKIIFDTDVLIEHLRGNDRVTDALKKLSLSKDLLAYTVITEAELFHGARNKHEEKIIDQILSVFYCLDVNREIGRQAGHYLNRFHKSHGMDVADALIAASAKIHGYYLCTFNLRHYPMNDIEKHTL